jgi:hypothetical protein
MIEAISVDTGLLAVLVAWAAWVTRAIKRLIKHCPLLNDMESSPPLEGFNPGEKKGPSPPETPGEGAGNDSTLL